MPATPDLFYAGTHGPHERAGGFQGLLIGNTAESVLTQCNCDVLAFKPAGFVSRISPVSWRLGPFIGDLKRVRRHIGSANAERVCDRLARSLVAVIVAVFRRPLYSGWFSIQKMATANRHPAMIPAVGHTAPSC